MQQLSVIKLCDWVDISALVDSFRIMFCPCVPSTNVQEVCSWRRVLVIFGKSYIEAEGILVTATLTFMIRKGAGHFTRQDLAFRLVKETPDLGSAGILVQICD